MFFALCAALCGIVGVTVRRAQQADSAPKRPLILGVAYADGHTAYTRQQLGSMHHLALLVPDMQRARETLRAGAGDSAQIKAPQIGRNRRWQLNLFDPNGSRIELMEPFPLS